MPVRFAPELDFRPKGLHVLRVHAERPDVHQRRARIFPRKRGAVQEPAVKRPRETDQALHERARGRMAGLDLVAESPCQNRGVVPVTEDHLPEARCGKIGVRIAPEDGPGSLHERDLLHRQESVPVAQIEHVGVRGMPDEPDEVRPHCLDERDVLFPFFVCHGAPPRGRVLVPAYPFDEKPFPVELETVARHGNAPYPGRHVEFIDNARFVPRAVLDVAFYEVEVGGLRTPEPGVLQDNGGERLVPLIAAPDKRNNRAPCNERPGHLVKDFKKAPGRRPFRSVGGGDGTEAVRAVRAHTDRDPRGFAVVRRLRPDNRVTNVERGSPEDIDVARDPAVIPHPPGRGADGKRRPRIKYVVDCDTDGIVVSDLEGVPGKGLDEAREPAAVRRHELAVDGHLRGMIHAEHHDVKLVLVELFFRQLNAPLEHHLPPEVVRGGNPDSPGRASLHRVVPGTGKVNLDSCRCVKEKSAVRTPVERRAVLQKRVLSAPGGVCRAEECNNDECDPEGRPPAYCCSVLLRYGRQVCCNRLKGR